MFAVTTNRVKSRKDKGVQMRLQGQAKLMMFLSVLWPAGFVMTLWGIYYLPP